MKKRDVGATHRVRQDEVGENFPEDWFEAVVVFTALVFIGGGAFTLYYLSQGMPV